MAKTRMARQQWKWNNKPLHVHPLHRLLPCEPVRFGALRKVAGWEELASFIMTGKVWRTSSSAVGAVRLLHTFAQSVQLVWSWGGVAMVVMVVDMETEMTKKKTSRTRKEMETRKEKGKFKGKDKNDGKGGKGGGSKPSVNKATTQSTSPPTSTASKDEREEIKNDGDSKPPAGMTPTAPAGKEAEGLAAGVTSLLKSMRVAQSGGGKPALSAIKLRKMEAGRQTTVLLDGGATNCLRRACSDREYQEAEPVQVSLASGSVSLRQSPMSRTLLGQRRGAADRAVIGLDQYRSVNWMEWSRLQDETCRPDPPHLPGRRMPGHWTHRRAGPHETSRRISWEKSKVKDGQWCE